MNDASDTYDPCSWSLAESEKVNVRSADAVPRHWFGETRRAPAEVCSSFWKS